jgi:hypothetical protein
LNERYASKSNSKSTDEKGEDELDDVIANKIAKCKTNILKRYIFLYYFKFNIQTFLDSKSKILYIHMESIYDTNNIFDLLLNNSNQLDENKKNFFELWEKEQSRYVKSILLLFSISHVIIVRTFSN